MKKLLFIILLMMTQHTMAEEAKTEKDNKLNESNCRTVDLTFIHTCDVHGAVFSYNYFTQKQTDYGLPAIFAYIDSLRDVSSDNLIVTDGGDCLQGQATSYYYNFVDTVSPHLITEVMNRIGYTCAVIGNHDIETGHPVYDRWIKDLKMPVLGANMIDTRSGKPYLTPYYIINKAGIKIALLGMTTPAIPFWLPKNLWTNIKFEDITTCSRKWIKEIQEKDKPDLIVGIFHSGFNGGISQEGCIENAVEECVKEVPGFDFVLYGHDHRAAVHEVVNVEGKTVKCMGPTSDGARFVQADVRLTLDGNKVIDKEINGSVLITSKCKANQGNYKTDNAVAQLFEAEFVEQRLTLNNWVNQTIGYLSDDMDGTDAYFGPSKFIDFVHQIQLELTGADISFTAPLSFRSQIKKGALTVNDMFRLYKFENFLYTIRLSGKEIKDYLEMSYALWTNQMKSADDHIMLLKNHPDVPDSIVFSNWTYNFDSAAGIKYEVDVTKPQGQKIRIISMADGTPFDLEKDYKVAVNSYRGNGGGELLTQGAGIPREQLSSRIIASTDKDLRYNMIQQIKQLGTITPKQLNHWKFVPEDWTEEAIKRDRKTLFGE